MLRKLGLLGVLLLFGMCAMVSAELISYHPFDEGSGDTAVDVTGNGNDATLSGGVEWVPGYKGTAVHLDTAGERLVVNEIDPSGENDAMTLAAWVNWEGAGHSITHQGIFGKRQGWDPRTLIKWFWEAQPSGQLAFRNGDAAVNAAGALSPHENEWAHVAVTWDDGAVVQYVNAEEVGTGTQTFRTTADATVVSIGCVSATNTETFVGAIDEARMYNTALTAAEIGQAMIPGAATGASGPMPADGATDVRRDPLLTWIPGEFAETHDVYMGLNFDDVNEASRSDDRGVLVSQGQTDTTYDPGMKLQLNTTYYWRVDEVNAPSAPATFKGDTWNFTVEPESYPLTGVTATASSEFGPTTGAANVVNGSGLNAAGEHDIETSTMWMTAVGDPGPWWIQFDLGRAYALHEMQVWNHNQGIEGPLGFGAKDVTIETSVDEETWVVLEGVSAFDKAPGLPNYQAGNTVAFNSTLAQYVRITILNNHGGIMPQSGLAEVRFSYIPVVAREPVPADGAILAGTDVVLGWRPGREADQHEVVYSTDQPSVIDGSAVVTTIPETTYNPGPLNLGSAYFWRINEVNDAGVNPRYEGPLWKFKTPESRVIDDMELYEDAEFLEIWSFWADGYEDSSNGSVVGNGSAPEEVEVYEGGKSMPMAYDNSAAPKSEATRTFDPPLDLTAGSPDSLNVYFKGVPYEFNGFYSQDGPSFWTEMTLNPLGVSMSDDATIGLAVTSHNRAAVATGVFTDVQTEGAVTGDWTIEAIGSADAGHPADTGSISGSTATIMAGGNDIWGTADEFVYVYKQFTGDGSITAKVESLEEQDNWTKAGVMIRNSADASASYASVQVTGVNGIRFQYRDADGVSAEGDTDFLDGTQELLSEPAWIKIERKVANDAASVYLTITDTSNKSVKTAHPDPAATRLGSWTQLSVSLKDLSGINLSSIKSITVGVEGGGAIGQLYVDYLYVTTPYKPFYDLMAHYALDGDVTDSSGNGFDGTITGAPAFIDGAMGQGLEFANGDGSGNDYVTIGTVDPSFYSGQLSVSLFAKWNGLSGAWQGLIGKRDTWDPANMAWDIEANRDNGTLRFGRNGSTVGSGGMILPEGEWEHVGVTYDGATLRFYVGGVLTNSGGMTFGSDTSASLQFGCGQVNGGNPFNGALDEIKIYDRPLSDTEMADLAQ